jgi:hypothetical protein
VERLETKLIFSNILGGCSADGTQIPISHLMVTLPVLSLMKISMSVRVPTQFCDTDIYKLSNKQAEIPS